MRKWTYGYLSGLLQGSKLRLCKALTARCLSMEASKQWCLAHVRPGEMAIIWLGHIISFFKCKMGIIMLPTSQGWLWTLSETLTHSAVVRVSVVWVCHLNYSLPCGQHHGAAPEGTPGKLPPRGSLSGSPAPQALRPVSKPFLLHLNNCQVLQKFS